MALYNRKPKYLLWAMLLAAILTGSKSFTFSPSTTAALRKIRVKDQHQTKTSWIATPSEQCKRSCDGSSSTVLFEGVESYPDWTREELENMEPKVYPQRWIQLAYLSVLALLSDWICFAVAASPSTFEMAYPGHSAASIIDLFLFTNVLSCFFVTDLVAKHGLSKMIKFAAVLMTAGCVLRSGFSFLSWDWVQLNGVAEAAADPSLVPYWAMVAGTVLVGFSQPFFQCTPPMLSAKWFASDERATSTAVALNFNQIGIATAFLVGGAMATTIPGLGQYLTLTSGACLAVMVGTLLQFKELPPTPPSTSEIDKLIKGEKEPPFLESVKKFFNTPGFTGPFTAFVCSISITNIVGAFIDEVLERGGITEQFFIDLAGAGFEFAILLGGIIIGGYVDRTKEYKKITLACLAVSVFLCIPLGLTDHALGQEPILLIAALLGLGFSVGPVQPVNAELAVDVSYPCDETAVESVQQIGGNLFSALIIPVAEIAARQDYELLPGIPNLESDIRGDVVLLSIIALATYGYFTGFEAPLRRTMADCSDDETCNINFITGGGDGFDVVNEIDDEDDFSADMEEKLLQLQSKKED